MIRRNYIVLCILCLCGFNDSLAQEKHSDILSVTIAPKGGITYGKTSFNIAGNEQGQNPNVLSELIWDKTLTYSFGTELNFKYKNYFLNTSVQLRKNISGDVSDIDYSADNRKSPYSKLYLSNHKGNGTSFHIEPGISFVTTEKSDVAIFLSFQHDSQNNYLLNYKHWSSKSVDYLNGLNSHYKYSFPNYGLGASLKTLWTPQIETNIAVTGHLSKYYAYGNWNLISDFEHPISYEHKGNGFKINPEVVLQYHISPLISLSLDYGMDYFQLKNGKDYLYTKSDGLLKARLNEVSYFRQYALMGVHFKLQ